MSRAAYQKQWRKDHPERVRAYQRRYHQKNATKISKAHALYKRSARGIALARRRRIRLRALVIQRYGGDCACCHEKQIEFLGIDHIYGGGADHRKIVGSNFYHWLVKHRYPPGFRVLCHNCNLALGFYGRCPHGLTQQRVVTAPSPDETRQLKLIEGGGL